MFPTCESAECKGGDGLQKKPFPAKLKMPRKDDDSREDQDAVDKACCEPIRCANLPVQDDSMKSGANWVYQPGSAKQHPRLQQFSTILGQHLFGTTATLQCKSAGGYIVDAEEYNNLECKAGGNWVDKLGNAVGKLKIPKCIREHKELKLAGDFSTIKGKKEEFLKDCTRSLRMTYGKTLECVDAKEGSIIITIEGSLEHLDGLKTSAKSLTVMGQAYVVLKDCECLNGVKAWTSHSSGQRGACSEHRPSNCASCNRGYILTEKDATTSYAYKVCEPAPCDKVDKNAEQTADESKNECECKDGYVGSLSPTTKEPYWTGRCAPNEVTALDAMLNNNQDAEAILNQYLLAKDEKPQYKAGKEILEKARDNLIKVKSRYRNCYSAS